MMMSGGSCGWLAATGDRFVVQQGMNKFSAKAMCR